MKPSPSLHSDFFSSLKQVEKRLKIEDPSQTQLLPLKQQEIINNLSVEESLSSPIYLHLDQPDDNLISPTSPESSELPQAFLSCSPPFPPTHENPPQPSGPHHQEIETEAVDDIEQLIQHLGLSDFGEKREEDGQKRRVGNGFECGSCHCEGGFYSKIAGVKGPKCGKEVERLEGWINYFLNGGGGGGDGGERGNIEPLRLSLLLLGKAAFSSGGGDCGFGGLDFPSAIEDFLMNDPPAD